MMQSSMFSSASAVRLVQRARPTINSPVMLSSTVSTAPRRTLLTATHAPHTSAPHSLRFLARANSNTSRAGKPEGEQASQSQARELTDPPVPSLPFLPRPLGVKQYPTTLRGTWKGDMMNQEKRMAERELIVKEATKGYWHDLNATRLHGGKTWIAPRVLIREDKALYFPDIEGAKLSDGKKVHTTSMCHGKISVISMLSTRISELHAEGFVSKTNEAHLSNPRYQYIQINLQENILKSFLVNLFTRSIKSQVPAHLHDTYLVSTENMEALRQPLGMTNKHIGYTFLVDDKLRVRWAGCGDAKGEEAEGLDKCVRQLLERLEAPKNVS